MTVGGQFAQGVKDYTWVWSDWDASYLTQNFVAQKVNSFIIRALNGVGINTNNPQGALDVNGRDNNNEVVT